MAHEWLGDMVQAVGDNLGDAIRGWRPAHQFGCLFTFFGVVGLLFLLLIAFGDKDAGPAGWVFGGFAAVGAVGAVGCFWLGSRPVE